MEGRTSEDLLFQVLLEWGLEVTLPIAVEQISGHDVFVVDDGALIACFEARIGGDALRAIAKRQPAGAVFLDSGFDSDAERINLGQIFDELSPATKRKVI